jgi:glycosyltransferase involved in cell wall biosynthesis
MKDILLRGPSLTQSGYGVHCRQIAKWLFSKKDINVNCQALPWGDTPWIINFNSHNGLIEKIMKATADISERQRKYDLSLQLQLPNEWDNNLANFNVGITAGVETTSCNPEWVDHCNKMDMVIVPSKHAAESLSRTGQIKKPLVVVPESFCEEIENIDQEKIDSLPKFSTNFNFLVFGQITGDNPMNDRKNIFFTIKWLCEAFKDDKDVGIVIKTNVGRNTHIDKKRTTDIISAIVRECRKSDFPKIHILHGEMHESDVAALYRHPQIKALVSLTRGEGYGLPLLEAAASELPIVATGWSGHLDFLNHGKYINISYALKEIHSSRVDDRIFIKGAQWAEASEDDFKKKIIKFRNNSASPKEWAKELSTIIRKNYSQEAISKQYDELLKEFI